MNRRQWLGGSISAGLLASATSGWPRATRAQRPNVPAIGILDPVWGPLAVGAHRGLTESGLVAGRDFTYARSGWSGQPSEFQTDQLAKYAAELVKQQVALFLTSSNKAALAAKSVTDTTPIVFLADDPVAAGFVDQLTHPGGNLTGVANLDSGLMARKIEVAWELLAFADLVVLVTDPTNQPTHDVEVREAQAAVKSLGLELSVATWTGEHSVETVLAPLPRDRKAVLVFGSGLPFVAQRAHLAYMAVQYGFPAIHGFRQAAEEGGMISFGTRLEDGGLMMGSCAARILRGEKPADLPVQKLMRTEFIVNRWPAKSLGLRIPPTILARADEVIG